MLLRNRQSLQKNFVSKQPTQLYLELSTCCTLRCRTCPRNAAIEFHPDHFPVRLLDQLLDSISQLTTLQRIVLLGYGEALCHPDFSLILKRLAATAIPVILITNAQLVSREHLDLLMEVPVEAVYVSWDDLDQERTIRVGSDNDLTRNVVTELRYHRKSQRPLVGVEIVALESNRGVLTGLVSAARRAGAEHVIVTNVFPYQKELCAEAIFTRHGRPETNFHRLFGWVPGVETAGQIISDKRICPFIERGTLFVTSRGEVVPCLELAHTHTAWYFNSGRVHYRFPLGNISERSLSVIWEDDAFTQFRARFEYYEFPDCLQCTGSDMCLHRSSRHGDCFMNGTPCGECLWARGIIRCP